MKTFKLSMMAAILAFASTAMAQDLVPITADDITLANGETKELIVKLNYELEAGAADLCGANFSLYLPDGVLLAAFNSVEEQTNAKAKALNQNCDVEEVENGVWSEDDADNGYVSITPKTDGGLLFIIMDQSKDKTPYIKTTDATLCSISIKAIADVKGTGKISNQGITNTLNVSVGMKDGVNTFGDCEFGINETTVGINEIQTAGSEAPAYNLQGIRVNNAKGLIIRDAKKMIVK